LSYVVNLESIIELYAVDLAEVDLLGKHKVVGIVHLEEWLSGENQCDLLSNLNDQVGLLKLDIVSGGENSSLVGSFTFSFSTESL
jgi:hypothetical protein